MNENIDSLIDSICQLIELNNAENDRYAAGLYRAMFRNETDLDKIDLNYGDAVLGYASMGCQNAIEDYKNYLLYIKKLYPSVYPEYVKMFDDLTKPDEEDEA